jgi:hypothetical protein
VHRHRSDEHRGVLWIDAPDIDSVEEQNRLAALAWLPHVDLVCYVVSPERYRDDAGWRILKQRGGRHGWMFVINRWDEGDAQQRDDFARLLAEAGFEQPVPGNVLSPGGAPVASSPDEFDQIEPRWPSYRRIVEEFTRLGHRALLICGPRPSARQVRNRMSGRRSPREPKPLGRDGGTILGGEWAMRALAARCGGSNLTN